MYLKISFFKSEYNFDKISKIKLIFGKIVLKRQYTLVNAKTSNCTKISLLVLKMYLKISFFKNKLNFDKISKIKLIFGKIVLKRQYTLVSCKNIELYEKKFISVENVSKNLLFQI